MRVPSRLRLLLDRARTSYFVIPGTAGVGAFALAILTLSIDRGGLPFPVPIPVEKMEDARSLLTTIASTSIGMAATVFSITIVVLSLASSQFGPRLLRNFLKNRSSQVVLGCFVATHVFCLAALRTAGSAWDVPQLTCLVALMWAMLDALALVYFIHHTASWVQVDRIIDVVGDRLDDELQRLAARKRHYATAAEWRDRLGEPTIAVRTPRAGYLQTHDDLRLATLAREHDLVIERLISAGDFVFAGRPIAHVWGECEEELTQDIQENFGMGDSRSDLQDPWHLLDQLVELALRALSPGINDPTTARTCLDRMANALLSVISRPFPATRSTDPAGGRDRTGAPHLLATPPDLAHLCERAFGEVRRAGEDQWIIVRRLEEVLPVLIDAAEQEAVRTVLCNERDLLPSAPLRARRV